MVEAKDLINSAFILVAMVGLMREWPVGEAWSMETALEKVRKYAPEVFGFEFSLDNIDHQLAEAGFGLVGETLFALYSRYELSIEKSEVTFRESAITEYLVMKGVREELQRLELDLQKVRRAANEE